MNQYFVLERAENGKFVLSISSILNRADDPTRHGFETYDAARRHKNSLTTTAFVVKHYNQDDFNRDYTQEK